MEEKGTTEDEMVGWHHRLNRLEFEQISGDGEEQESLKQNVQLDLKFLNYTHQIRSVALEKELKVLYCSI